MTTSPDAEWYRQRLHEVMTGDHPFAERQRRVLELGREYLGVETAFVADIDVSANTFAIVGSTADDASPLGAGATHDLSETYCRHTIGMETPLSLHDVDSDPEWADEPARTVHGLSCYLGAAITVNGDVYGTVCFVDSDPRTAAFSEAERTFATLIARLLGGAIERRRHEAELAERDEELDSRERELKLTERKYETLVETAPDAIFVADVDTGEIVEANEAAARLTGYPRETLVGMDVEAFYPDDQADQYRALYRTLDGGVGDDETFVRARDGQQLHLVGRDGERIPVAVSATVTEMDGERVVQGIVRDVTRRRERLERLQRSEARARSLVEASFDIAFRVSFDGIVTDVSEQVESLLGYRPTELVGEHFSVLMPHADDVADSLTGIERVLDGEPAEVPYVEFETADGESRFMDLRAAPIYGSDDRPSVSGDTDVVGIQGMARDVTERYERERELRVRTRAIETAGVGIVISDPTRPGNPIIYANEQFQELTGYDEEEVVGRNCRLLQGQKTRPEAVATLREAVEAGEQATTELVNYRADGTPFWNHVSVTPVTDDDGTVTNFVGFQKDVTKEKRREQLLKVLNRILRHNLRNSMNVVQGFAGNLEQELRERGEQTLAQYADVVDATAADLLNTSETARALEDVIRRAEAPERVDVVPFVEDAVARAEREHPDADVRVDTPARAEALADDTLTEALWELVDNAIRYGDETVRVSVERGDDTVVVGVRDDGPGLPTQDESVLREGRETPLDHGSGLGLWLVNWVVSGVGGRIETLATEDGSRIELVLREPTSANDAAGQHSSLAFTRG